MRYDLAFFLCCCKSFLGGDESGEENFYSLLEVEKDASYEDIKKAYKKKSLQMHPDKLAQRGEIVTEELQTKFTRMKEAYEVLSDPHKRETYDAIGERGMKWLEEPFSIDPQQLAHNFANSSVLDRSKIFAIFVGAAAGFLLLPILICLHLDGMLGDKASWFATFTPLWIWDGFLLFYYTRVIMMGPFERPEHVPPEEWVDPLPMEKRYMSLFRNCLLTAFELGAALKLDSIIYQYWSVVFIPLYIYEATIFYKKYPMLQKKIVTYEDLESALGQPMDEFTDIEKEVVEKRYFAVPSLESKEFAAAELTKADARRDLVKSTFRIIFYIFLIIQLDHELNISWWLVFLPVWLLSVLVCLGNYLSFVQVQETAAQKDPSLFGLQPSAEEVNTSSADYGAVGVDGTATADAAASSAPQLTEEEREELKGFVTASASNLMTTCCWQGFILILVCLFVAKLQGASFSALWIISPFLLTTGIVLLCLALAIFGMSEQSTDEFQYEANHQFGEGSPLQNGAPESGAAVPMGMSYAPPSADVPPPATEVDPEKGEQSQTVDTSAAEQATAVVNAVDHLDDAAPAPASSQQNTSTDSSIHELD